MEYTGSIKADHLCVLVHGLWGNPSHMQNIAKTLRAQFSRDELHLLLAKQNSGSFTYDGIERGGERVCAEIEQEMRDFETMGGKITKLSIVGYSLGGLVSRYAVGLLDAKGVLDTVQCMNFTTFASPHLGVRSPLKGWHNHVWNVLGARTLSMSGRQLFTIDKFRDTDKPLLAVLADPSSIFISGLRKFKRRTLYANVANDRSVVYYTACIAKTDPYTDKENIKVNYVKGYENIILDPQNPVAPSPKIRNPTTFSSVSKSAVAWLRRIPFFLTIAVFVPIGVLGFLVNSVIQTIRSSSRIKLHETGKAGVNVEEYRMPVWITEMRDEVEQAYEALNSSQSQDYLATETEDEDGDIDPEDRRLLSRERRMSTPAQPTLALAPHQFEMVRNLDSLGWRKYPVWIHNIGHSHAAIIVRWEKPTFEEGHVVLKHYANEEFLI
ncbi:hypothetical protein G7046_g6976 [Stylonectria norvegica]|nr:hypothetical protein G7046_g6976 [Stylonectria norvegica]